MNNPIHRDLCMRVKLDNVYLSAHSSDVYALVIPDVPMQKSILDNCKIGALDNVPISEIDDLRFYDILKHR